MATHRLVIRVMSAVHLALYRFSRGLLGANVGAPVLLLTTLGRKSKQFRTTPLLYVEEMGRWIVVASNAGDDCHPNWWLNLKANPEATIQIKSIVKQVRAREANPMERDRIWSLLVDMYSVYDDYQRRTSRKIPVVILDPCIK